MSSRGVNPVQQKNRAAQHQKRQGGILVCAPTCSGKSTFVNAISQIDSKIVDGDIALNEAKIEHSLGMWMKEGFDDERRQVVDHFRKLKANGYTVLYSGDPTALDADVIVPMNPGKRWALTVARCKELGIQPDKKSFDIETSFYRNFGGRKSDKLQNAVGYHKFVFTVPTPMTQEFTPSECTACITAADARALASSPIRYDQLNSTITNAASSGLFSVVFPDLNDREAHYLSGIGYSCKDENIGW